MAEPDEPRPTGGQSGWCGPVALLLMFGFGFGQVNLSTVSTPAGPPQPGATVGAECSATELLVEDRNRTV